MFDFHNFHLSFTERAGSAALCCMRTAFTTNNAESGAANTTKNMGPAGLEPATNRL